MGSNCLAENSIAVLLEIVGDVFFLVWIDNWVREENFDRKICLVFQQILNLLGRSADIIYIGLISTRANLKRN